jgi:hypothetical protein
MARRRLARVAITTRRARVEELRAAQPPATVAVTWDRAWSRGLWGTFLPERRAGERSVATDRRGRERDR